MITACWAKLHCKTSYRKNRVTWKQTVLNPLHLYIKHLRHALLVNAVSCFRSWQSNHLYVSMCIKVATFCTFFPPYTLLFSASHIQNNTGQNDVGQGLLYVCHLFVFHVVYNICGDSSWFRYFGEVILNTGWSPEGPQSITVLLNFL